MSEPLPDSVGMGGVCPTVARQIDPRTKVRVWLNGNANRAFTVTAVTRRDSETVTIGGMGDVTDDTTAMATEATAYPYVLGGVRPSRTDVWIDGRVFQSFHGDGGGGEFYAVYPLDA